MSKVSNKKDIKRFKAVGDHHKFLERITKTLYYGKLPLTERLSFPVTELATELFSEPYHGRSLDRLHCYDAAKISRNACVSPCALVLAMLYLERLKICNPEYLQHIAPSELFLVSLMVSTKFLNDDGAEDEVFVDEWATSGGISIKYLIQLEREFLNAMQWEIFVPDHVFWKKLKEMETTLAKREGTIRGWLTYTELQNLVSTIDVYNLIQCLAVVSTILAVTYTVGILTLLGSIFIISNIPGHCLQTRNIYLDNTKLYLTTKAELNMQNTSANEEVLTQLENDIKNSSYVLKNDFKPLDASDVLKTGILLASIKTVPNNSTKCFACEMENASEDQTPEYVTWDWWSNKTMQWLTKASKLVENFDFISKMKQFTYNYADITIANSKIITQQDQVHKATKVRIQEQMERSWHKEWTDSFKNALLKRQLFSLYFGYIKA